VLAIVLQAVVRIGSRALKNNIMRALAALAFLRSSSSCAVPGHRAWRGADRLFRRSRGCRPFQVGGGHGAGRARSSRMLIRLLGEELPAHANGTIGQSLRQAATVWLVLWLAPVGTHAVASVRADVFSQIATFFSTMAMVTFGGAYAVLAYVAQQAVDHYHWLAPGEMLDGLGMAETTPGPLIMVLQFVGFMAAYRASRHAAAAARGHARRPCSRPG
jgi:chromate transporter